MKETLFLLGHLLKGPIPLALQEYESLKVLDLSSNMITSFLPTCNLLKLEVLRLANNDITSIPRQIENLVKLRELVLSGNGICMIPDNVFQLSELRVLDMSSNTVSYIPDGLAKLAKLRVLNFRCNPLLTLPAELERLKSLETMDFTETRLPLDLQTSVEKDTFMCQMYGVEASKRFGKRKASNAAVFVILAMRKYPEKGCQYFAALDENTTRKICEMVLESGVREEKEWERARMLMEKKMINKEMKSVQRYTTNAKEEDCYDKEEWSSKVKEGKEFEEMGQYKLALKFYEMAQKIRYTDNIQWRIEAVKNKSGM